jgi:hypothetical protein
MDTGKSSHQARYPTRRTANRRLARLASNLVPGNPHGFASIPRSLIGGSVAGTRPADQRPCRPFRSDGRKRAAGRQHELPDTSPLLEDGHGTREVIP